MHKFLSAAAILLAGIGLANADVTAADKAAPPADKTPPPPPDKAPPPKIDPKFDPKGKIDPKFKIPNQNDVVSITKVDGDKITLTKSMFGVAGKPEVLVAAEGIKVVRKGSKIDPNTKQFEETDVEEGLKNKLFKKATVSARIILDGDKVAKIVIVSVQSDGEIRAIIKKVDGDKITYMKIPSPGTPGSAKPEDVTVAVSENLKVLEYSFKEKGKEPTPVAAGLKDPAFARLPTMVLIVTDDDNKISEIRLNPPPPGFGPGPPPPPPPPPPPKS